MGIFNIFRCSPPPTIDDDAVQFASEFVVCPAAPTFGAELLDPSLLDFSLDSLTILDRHVEALRDRDPEAEGQNVGNFFMRCGCYLGEVIRRHSAKEYHWYDASVAAQFESTLSRDSYGTSGVLWAAPTVYCYPIQAVMDQFTASQAEGLRVFAERQI